MEKTGIALRFEKEGREARSRGCWEGGARKLLVEDEISAGGLVMMMMMMMKELRIRDYSRKQRPLTHRDDVHRQMYIKLNILSHNKLIYPVSFHMLKLSFRYI
jgi:hypothetical protein